MDKIPCYTVSIAKTQPSLMEGFDSPAWQAAKPVKIAHFRPESSSHRPETAFRMVYNENGLHGIFQVHDQYVRAAHLGYQSEVWKDSCVEVFIQPKPGMGYFNFEMNCGGSLLCSHVIDPTRTHNGSLKSAVKIPEQIGRAIQVRSTLPRKVDPEIPDPVCWELAFFVPFTVIEAFAGPLGPIKGQEWRGNFYKCAEEVSHPHWAAWAPVDALNFHLPNCFGRIVFE